MSRVEKMSSWRNEVTKLFYGDHVSLFIVNDPDLLLNDETILSFFDEKEIKVLRFDDSISIRYLYESQYRGLLENNQIKLLVYSNEEDQEVFPYDFLQKGNHLLLSINRIFPRFSPTILKQLDKEDLDSLFAVQSQYLGSTSDKDTIEFILRYVYKIVYELIDSKEELYKLLFTIHYEKRDIPIVVKEYLISQILKDPIFEELPVNHLIQSSHDFYVHIDKEWAMFVKELMDINNNTVLEETAVYRSYPFSNSEVRRLMNDLFLEGYLRKVKISRSIALPSWMKYGVEINEIDSQKETISLLHTKLIEQLAKASRYKDWISIVDTSAEYKTAALSIRMDSAQEDANKLIQEINKKFEKWMIDHFHSLTSLPPFPKLKMVHHIVQKLASSNNEKIALLVLDGMSFTQWKRIKQHLLNKNFRFEEAGVYAWVPTLTSISRQAIFSGQIPAMFANHLRTTTKEESHWKTFWEDHGVLKQYVQYQKGLGKEVYNKTNILAFKRPNIKIYGAVVDIIDSFVHGAAQGEKSIMAELDIWLQTDYLSKLLTDLTSAKFAVYLTSDHGNTEAVGVGRVSEGVLVDQKGERVRVYTDEVIYRDSLENIESIRWSGVGLPEDYHVLLAKYGQAFVTKDERIVSHGGISLEEVIVPFVKVYTD